MAQTAQEVMQIIADNNIELVDLRFIDLLGISQHVTFHTSMIEVDTFTSGLAFDGSSIRGWKAINDSDMLMIPDPTTAVLDPFTQVPTLNLTCSISEARTGIPYSRDPRTIAEKAVTYLQSTGIADTAYFGPEAEFFIFDEVRFDQNTHSGYYYVDSVEGNWNSGRVESGGNLGYKPKNKGGYFPVPPTDSQQDMRSEMLLTMGKMGVPIEKHHHEVASGGQAELGYRFAPLVQAADYMMTYKYVIKNVARKYGKTVTFMPKPLYGDNGTGMHTHQSLWKDGKPLFAGDGYAGLSETCLYYIGGILKHAPALLAFTNPSTNSYKRLVPGFEAPVNLAYSSGNRSASVRIPVTGTNPKAKRLEFRCPDASCNPYLAFAAMLLAGLDGIKNQIHPGEPLDVDIYELSPEELAKVPSTPGSLAEALENLKNDHDFLLAGDVFTEDLINTWIEYKLSKEVIPIQMRPHPYEFELYYDV
ncbi:type I glutamate--ammonia ligase [Anthocerotibacter panamensis]|uniref:type I glutamate--ammonia ligase n=1 Tax=Anthocerotibacter panamensis TaxID=2857077 RepID=UPI001C405EE0|nr:type I glutamate--ammonia ligase [Anthocerotibacter panamensis]